MPNPAYPPREDDVPPPREEHPLYPGPPLYPAPDDEEGWLGRISPHRLLMVFRRKWKLIAATVAFALLTGAYIIWTTTPIYETHSLVEVLLRRPRILAQRDAVIEDSGYDYSGKTFNTHVQRLKGAAVRRAALAAFRQAHPENEISDRDLWKTFSISFKPLGNSRLIQIRVRHAQPEVAAALANAFGEAAVQTVLLSNKEVSDNAVAWLQSQAAAQRKLLEKADNALLQFRANNNVEALRNRKKTVEQALLAFNESLVGVERDLALAHDLVDELARLEATPEGAGRLPTSTPHAAELAAIFDEWSQARAQLAALLARYTERHPKVLNQQQHLAHLRARLVDSIGRARATAQTNLALLTEQADSLRQKKKEQEDLANAIELDIVRGAMQIKALERERDAADISYRGILTRIQEARLSADENTATIKFVEPAPLPESPIRPRRPRIWLASLTLGLLAGILLALVSDRLDDHIWSVRDVEQGLGLKVLGLIPHAEDAQRRELALACAKDRFSRVTESVAGIRAFLGTDPYRDACRTLLVVSAAPEEGKTIFSCNLAISLARSGKRTLLVDMDLRRPRLRHIFQVPTETPGLMQTLAEEDPESLTRLPRETGIPNLAVVVSFPKHDLSPAELLGSRHLETFMAWARNTYDCVIIDSPPLGAVSDAVALGGLADAVLLLCRPLRSRRRPTLAAVRHLADTGAHILGVVLNDVPVGARGYDGYHDSAYYHYPHYTYYAHQPDTEAEPAAPVHS